MRVPAQRENQARRLDPRTKAAGSIPIVHEALAAPGRPLDPGTRDSLEPRFGHDLGHVRIHTDVKAAESARAVNASAYTVGSQVVFGAGRYSPHTPAGQRLLAHEVAHTLQQPNASAAGVERISDPGDPVEAGAERAANDVMAGNKAGLTMAARVGTLYRQPLPDFAHRPSPRLAWLMGSELLDDFALNGAVLTEDHKGRLAVLAHTLTSLLRNYPSGSVQITGHTDASGEEEHNERLGQRRADAVGDYLLEAGVPAGALSAVSAGESELRVKTSRPEPRNRRVQIRFEPEPRLRLGPGLELTPPAPPERKEVPSFEDSCIVFPERCRGGRPPGGFPVPEPPQKPPAEAPARCDSISNCSAVAVDSFAKQPPALQAILNASPLGLDPATWFRELGAERRSALTQIFNRLCRFGLWCHAREILKVVPGQAHVTIGGRTFVAPGLTPQVHFMSPSGDALYTALMATGKFCTAYGTGASKHPGQTTLREISGSDSLHISIGSKTSDDEFDAHIDLYSPVLEHPGSSSCPNDPSAAALKHIGNEVIPEMFAKILPGLQIFPDPPPPAPVPEGAAEMELLRGSPSFSVGGVAGLLGQILLKISRVTLRGPIRKRQPLVSPESKRVSPDVKELAEETAAKIAAELEQRVGPEALVPSRVKVRRQEARQAAEFAGLGEEDRLNKARDEAEAAVSSYADPHEVGLELAARLALAQDIGTPYVTIELPFYGGLDAPDHKFLAGEILRMALIVRKHLPNEAADVHHIQVFFGKGKKRKSVVVDLP